MVEKYSVYNGTYIKLVSVFILLYNTVAICKKCSQLLVSHFNLSAFLWSKLIIYV